MDKISTYNASSVRLWSWLKGWSFQPKVINGGSLTTFEEDRKGELNELNTLGLHVQKEN